MSLQVTYQSKGEYMKRSEVVLQIAKSFSLKPISEDQLLIADNILTVIERLGMKPPGYLNQVGNNIFEWEREDPLPIDPTTFKKRIQHRNGRE